MRNDFITACQMFLVPMTILFAAIAVASTEQLKTLISLVGLAAASIWYYAVSNWPQVTSVESNVGRALAGVFILAWAASTIAHGWLWWEQENSPRRTATRRR